VKDFKGKTAFVTGGANGIGLAMARSLGVAGANIMLADINADALEKSVHDLKAAGIEAASVVCNVANADDVRAAAAATIERFDKVHIVANNAGVSLAGKAGKTSLADWRWIVDINLMGVVHGIEIFVPLIKKHGEGGHIINTASMAGHWAAAEMGPYNATKFAVVGYSETIRQELAEDNIGVSVLCPAWVKTNIHLASLGAPSREDSVPDPDAPISDAAKMFFNEVENGLDPNLVGDWVVDSIKANRGWIFTHPDMMPIIDVRAGWIKADYQACVDDPRFASVGKS
jgi:NAD(P)-dependent dehydrogenase (short-subunit alcohol dehydrogenase family)